MVVSQMMHVGMHIDPPMPGIISRCVQSGDELLCAKCSMRGSVMKSIRATSHPLHAEVHTRFLDTDCQGTFR